jgi:hypothetical protein
MPELPRDASPVAGRLLLEVFQERVRSILLLGLEGGSPCCRIDLMEADLKSLIPVTLLSLMLTLPAFAQKLVDPTAVAPEYREAAEKRRAEQVKQRECAHKADTEKVMPRERTAFLLQCLEVDNTAK